MSNRSKYILCFLMFMPYLVADTVWTGSDPGNLWQTPANWTDGVPGESDFGIAKIDAGTTVIYDSGVRTGGAVNLGQTGDGLATMKMTSGTFYTASTGSNWFVIGFGGGAGGNPDTDGFLEVQSGASLFVGGPNPTWGDLIVGAHGGGNGRLNIAGGTIQCWQLLVGWYAGVGTVHLNGGVLQLPKPTGGLYITNRGLIDIRGGTIVQTGDFRSQYTQLVQKNQVIAYGGTGTVIIDYVNGKTVISSVSSNSQGPNASYNYCNPLEVKAADVYAFFENGTYYLYATNSQTYSGSTKGNPIWSSTDLVNWTYRGHTFSPGDTTWGQTLFWGPRLFKKGNVYYLYYCGFRNISGRDTGRICVATGPSPLGPFTEVKAPMFDWDLNQDVIAIEIFEDTDGKVYIYPTMTRTSMGNVIYGAELSEDMLTVSTTPVLCLKKSQAWEENPIIEGAATVKHNGIYYLTYSGNHFKHKYAVGYATSSNPLGPWTKYSQNPILDGTAMIRSPGSHSFINSPDGSETFIIYHSHIEPPGNRRQLNIDRMIFVPDPGKPDIMKIVNGPSWTPQPYPSGSLFTTTAVDDEFDGTSLDFNIWKNIWGQSKSSYALGGGKFTYTLMQGSVWQDMGDGENVFLQLAPRGQWEIVTQVTLDAQSNCEAAFLTVWQDTDNYITLNTNYVNRKTFEIGVERGRIYSPTIVPNSIGESVYLKIRKINNRTFQCFVSDNGQTWTKFGNDIIADFKDIKVGFGGWLAGSSRTGVTAAFDFFRINRISPSADIDGNEDVDLSDFLILAGTWQDQNCQVRLAGDLKEDCSTNILDLRILAEEWLLSVPCDPL